MGRRNSKSEKFVNYSNDKHGKIKFTIPESLKVNDLDDL